MSPARMARAMRRRSAAWANDRRRRAIDDRTPSYSIGATSASQPTCCFRLPSPYDTPEWLAPVTAQYLRHEFDLLGSGWTHVRHGMECSGLEGHVYAAGPPVVPDPAGDWLRERVNSSNAIEAARLWSLLAKADSTYSPIDWQLDFKSGRRWSERTWYVDVTYGDLIGSDIKVPWELARMHHLPQLALAHSAARTGAPGLQPPERYSAEFRSQVLDFAAANPPRWGVNWSCAMDVGIRIANIAIAYDLFVDSGAEFDHEFLDVLARMMHEHASHIAGNLEWFEAFRSNHYLGNISGLLFAAAHLASTPVTDAWLALALQEVAVELPLQFQADGTSFEGSTAYHGLSAQMLAWCIALAESLPAERLEGLASCDRSVLPAVPVLGSIPAMPFSNDLAARLTAAAEFSADITAPNGEIVQIGDNDSGRLFRLSPTYRLESGDWAEHHLNQAPVRDVIATISGRGNLRDGAPAGLDGAIAGSALNRARTAQSDDWVSRMTAVGSEVEWSSIDRLLLSADAHTVLHAEHRASAGLLDGFALAGYPDFGLWILRSKQLYLSIRCGRFGQCGNGGHAHNDQLSIELWIDGAPVLRDPGTYLYGALPEVRNRYRSTAAHAAPRIAGREQAPLDVGLFTLPGAAGTCDYFGASGFIGHHGTDPAVYRRVAILDDRVVVDDWCEGFGQRPVSEPEDLPYSPGFGIVEGGA